MTSARTIEFHDIEPLNNFVYLGSIMCNGSNCEPETNMVIFPICLNGKESWTIKAEGKLVIDSKETWCYRWRLRIPWTPKRTISIIHALNVKTWPSSIWLKHITRRLTNNIKKLFVTRRDDGKCNRGRSPTRCMDQIRNSTGLSFQEAAG